MKQNPWLGLATYDETLISKGYKFCGRERAINELYSIIDNNIITTLYGKSGIGKSSLLQAGIFPLCRYNNYLPVMIRLGVGNNSTSASSYIDTVIASVEQCIQANNGSIQKNNDDTSTIRDTEKLWHFFHSSQFRNSNNDVIFPVIVLDQFEELYYRDRDQLNTLLKSIYLLLDDSSINGNSNESQIINYRIVISIREDDLFHLEDSIDKLRLTEMKDNRYRLRDFSEDEAFSVITVPGDNVFDKDDINSIADLIIKETKANSTEISSAVLSLICSRIFSSVQENRLITLDDVNLFFKDAQGNFLKSFYEDIRKKLTLNQWYFIEDELVTDEGRRDSVPESEFDKVIPDSLWLFEGEHSMLRKVTIQGSSEPRIEIIHDMLAMQMLSSKNERKLQEQARRLRRQRLTAFAIIAVIVALGVTFYLQYRSIVEERNNMYKMQSHYIAEKAEKLIEERDIYTAIRLLLNVLPENLEEPNRPYIEEAEYALRKAGDSIGSTKSILWHDDVVNSASFSPNGKFIVTVSRDNTAKIWNTETGKQVGETLKHDSWVNSASFSSDGRFIVTASLDNTAKIWNAETGKQVGETLKHDKSIVNIENYSTVNSASFSPNGKFIVTAFNDNTARIWNAKTGEQVKILVHNITRIYPLWNIGKVNSASFSPDGEFIVTASHDGITIWNAKTGEQAISTIFMFSCRSASFSPNGKFIVTASLDKTAKIWNAETGKQVGETLKHDSCVNSASFSPDGKFIVTASDDNTAKIWDAETGKQAGETLKHDSFVNSASFSPDGKFIVTASLDKTAKIWNAETGKQVGETLMHDDDVNSASFSPDGKFIVTTSNDGTAKIWNVETCIQTREHMKHEDDVRTASFSPDGKFIVTVSYNTAKIWDAETGKQIGETLKHKYDVNTASFSPDGKFIVTASQDCTAKIWNAKTGEQVGVTLMHEDDVLSASFSPDGKYIVTKYITKLSFHKITNIWNAKTGEQVEKTFMHDNVINSASFSPDGKFIVTVSYNTAKIWDAETGKQIGETLKHEASVNSASFSPDGKFIVTASLDKTAKIWNAETGKQVGETLDDVNSASFSPDGKYIIVTKYITKLSFHKITNIWNAKTGEQVEKTFMHDDDVNSASFSPDGKFIVTASDDNTAKIWDAETGKQAGETLKHDSFVNSASFSPDGKFIVTASLDKTAKIWNAETGKQVGETLMHDDLVHSASFSPDGKFIVTGSSDGIVKITEFIPLQDLIDRYKKLFGDWSLTEEELKEYNFK